MSEKRRDELVRAHSVAWTTLGIERLIADAHRLKALRVNIRAEFGDAAGEALWTAGRELAATTPLDIWQALDQCVRTRREADTTMPPKLWCGNAWPLQRCEMTRQQRRAVQRGNSEDVW